MAPWAAAAEPLTLDQAVTRALAAHPAVAAARADLAGGRARSDAARAALLPRLDLSESVTRSSNPVFAFGARMQQERLAPNDLAFPDVNHPDDLSDHRTQLALAVPLLDGNAWMRRRAAQAGVALADVGVRRVRLEVIVETVRAYHAVQLAEETARVASSALGSAEAELEQARVQERTGMASRADVLALETHAAAMKEQRIRADSRVRLARIELARALALPLDRPLELRTPLPEAVAVRPDGGAERSLVLEARRAQGELADAQVAQARASFLPTLGAAASWESHRPSFLGDGGTSWAVGVELRWNLFAGLGDRARLAEAAAAQARARADLAAGTADAEVEVRQARSELEAARQRLEVATAAVASAAEGARLTRQQFRAGLARATDVRTAETALLEAEGRRLGARFELLMSAVRLEAARGLLDRSSEVLR